MTIICQECGTEFERKHTKGMIPRFCPMCARMREIESNRRARAKYKEPPDEVRKRHQRWRMRNIVKFTFDSEAYAEFRENQRARSLRWRERHNPKRKRNGGCYKPRPSTRIPDYCTKGSVLDAQSMFLFVNATPEIKDYARRLFIERKKRRIE